MGNLSFKIAFYPAPNMNWENNVPVFFLSVFEEDTRAIKNELKTMGYTWEDSEWRKAVPFTEEAVNSCLTELSIFCKSLPDADAVLKRYSADLNTARKHHQAWIKFSEGVEKAKARRLPKPEILVGKNWNGKIYRNAIYLDGEKVVLSEDKLEEIKRYLESEETYSHKIKTCKTTLECENHGKE